MGRNAGTQIFWTHAVGPSDTLHTFTYVCQQHGKYAHTESASLTVAAIKTQTEINTDHGNVNQ